MKRTGFIVSCLLLTISAVQAEITVTNIALTAMDPPIGTNSYTIPVGKILAIEHISLGNTNTSVYFFQSVASGGIMSFIARDARFISYEPSLKMRGGLTLFAYGVSSAAVIHGLLVDPEDIYASIPCDFEQAAISGDQVSGTLNLSSPRPAHVVIQESEDLVNWMPDNSAACMPQSDKRHIDFIADRLREKNGFLRAGVRARE